MPLKAYFSLVTCTYYSSSMYRKALKLHVLNKFNSWNTKKHEYKTLRFIGLPTMVLIYKLLPMQIKTYHLVSIFSLLIEVLPFLVPFLD